MVMAAAWLVASLGQALAASITTTFNVTLTVTASCTVSATDLPFGSTGTIAADIDNTSSVTVMCTNTTPYNVGLDAGTGSGATVAVRKMTAGGATVNYSLYQNAARTTVWGNTIGTDTVTGTGSGSAQVVTVYGRVPAQTTPAPGSYTDIITTTVTY
jgi:spore coat protein U-like protein